MFNAKLVRLRKVFYGDSNSDDFMNSFASNLFNFMWKHD